MHRDIKPANLLLSEGRGAEQRILLSDFGIARQMGEVSGLTATNHTIGTVTYSSPEQLMGHHIDGRSDQYALAATAFRLLTGEPPYRESNQVAVISQHLNAPPPRVSARRAEFAPVDPVLMKAMAKNPQDRFHTCSEFAQALAHQAAAVSAQPHQRPGWPLQPTAMSPTPGAPTAQWVPAGPPHGLVHNQLAFGPPPRRSRRWIGIVAGIVAVVLVATGVIVALNVNGADSAGGSSTSPTRAATTSSRASSSTGATAFPMPTLVGTPGNYQTIQTYIQQNGIEEQSEHRGDTKAPTILTPIPDGWRDAGSESPNFAYQTLLYDGPDAPDSRPYVIVLVSKLVGNVDPAKVFAAAPGELYNLAGWVPDNPGKVAHSPVTPSSNSPASGTPMEGERPSPKRR